MSWYQQLQRASFAGVPFGVQGGQIRVGRRNAVHEYPFKDGVWVEDLGRAARRITLTGFLVENGVYGGGAVIAQRERMIAACESAGQSTLVHPTLGQLKVSLLESAFTERWDHGRVFEISFSFMEAGERQFPAGEQSTGDQVSQTCTALDAAAGADFVTAATASLPMGAAVVDMAVSTTSNWGGIATSLASDATSLMNSAGVLQGSFGRFFGGRARDITGTLASVFGANASTLAGLIAAGAMARGNVQTVVAALSAAAAALGVTTAVGFAAMAQSVAAAVLAATTDPADGVRVLGSLSAFTPTAPTPTSAVGTAMATMQSACGDLFRRAAVTAVARSSSRYQPASYDDAVAVRSRVTALLDAEIQIAGDQGEDGTYNAMRAVRSAVAQDLTARGASLAALATIRTPRPMPALVLAQRVYRDASRSDELIVEADAVHPCFMPTSFRALAQ